MNVQTQRLYLDDDHCLTCSAVVIAARADEFAADRTCFYPGGGGQPPDLGEARLSDGTVLPITGVRDEGGVIWHRTGAEIPEGALGSQVELAVDRARRAALTRYHTVLHILNTIVLRDYGAWITGVQMTPEYARIDFSLETLSPELCADVERKVNQVIAAGHPLRVSYVAEAEMRERTELLRTLNVRPPVVDGRVRVVTIEGFDAQACGGTHVPATDAVGTFEISRTENKGRKNKRLYVRLREGGPL